jgi:CheY-like chemotaxis protein
MPFVSDVVMPNLDGLGLCKQIRRERPEIKLLLMSGDSGPVEGIPFLRKSFKVEELKQKMRQLLRSQQSTGFSQSACDK